MSRDFIPTRTLRQKQFLLQLSSAPNTAVIGSTQKRWCAQLSEFESYSKRIDANPHDFTSSVRCAQLGGNLVMENLANSRVANGFLNCPTARGGVNFVYITIGIAHRRHTRTQNICRVQIVQSYLLRPNAERLQVPPPRTERN